MPNIREKIPQGESSMPEGGREIISREEFIGQIEKTDEQIREAGRRLEEVIPENRNFDIEVQKNEEGDKILLKREDGQVLDVSQFLPEGFVMSEEEEFGCDRHGKEVRFDKGHLKYRGFLLSLLHEVGHAHQEVKTPLPTLSELEKLKLAGELLLNFIKGLSIKTDKTEDGIKFDIQSTSLVDLFPDWYVEKEIPIRAAEERGAWASALKTLKQLDKDGYDVFAGFKNAKEIQALIGFHLSTYEFGRISDKLIAGDETVFDEKPLFYKKKKSEES